MSLCVQLPLILATNVLHYKQLTKHNLNSFLQFSGAIIFRYSALALSNI
jgi:hypothetical protein